MKRIGLVLVAGLFCGLAGGPLAYAGSLIVNGSFEYPSVGGGYAFYSNGQVPGWYTTDSQGLIEIDNSNIVGGAAVAGSQSLEVNANYPEAVDQLVTGLTVGQTYNLSWDYGVRPGSGAQQMQVLFGGSVITLESANYNNSSLLWFPENFTVTATSTSEVLSFDGLPDAGLTSYGNEIDNVAMVPTTATPEPSSLVLLGSGLALLAFGWAFGAERRTAAKIPSSSN